MSTASPVTTGGRVDPPQLASLSARRLAFAVGALGAAGLLLLDALVRDEPVPEDDDLIYERMAQDPLAPHTYVFAFRIAVPWVVHVLPFEHTTSFSLLAWICAGAASALLFLLLDDLQTPRRVSVPLALMLAVSPPLLVASLRQGRSPDPLTVLVMVAGALFIVRRRALPLSATMLVGALNRESALFLGPLAYAVWAGRRWDGDVARRVAIVAAPALAAFLAVRLTIPTVGRESVPGYGSLVGGRIEILEAALAEPFLLARRVAAAYGPLWLLAPFAFGRFWFARRGLVLIGLCLVACTFALDWGRIAVIAAPVVYAASAWTLTRHPRTRLPTLCAGVALVVGYAAYMQWIGVTNLIDAGPPPYPVR